MSTKPNPLEVQQIDALNLKARTLRDSDSMQSAAVASEALALAKQCNPPYELGIAQSYYHLAFANHRKGKVEDALECAFTALSKYKELAHRQGEFDCNHLIGHCYLVIGEDSHALAYFMASLKLADEIGLPVNKARAFHSIAIIQSHTGEYAQAIESNQQAIEYYRSVHDLRWLARTLNSCCVDYRCLRDYENALRYGEESYASICQVENSSYWQATSLSSIGEVYIAQGKYNQALAIFQQALELYAQSEAAIKGLEVIETLYNQGTCLVALGNEADAMQTLTQTLQLALQHPSQRIASQCHQQLAKLYESQQQYDLALQHFRSFHELDKEVFNEERAQQVTRLKVVYRTQQAQAKLEHQMQLREQDRLHYERLTALTNKFIRNLTHDLKTPLSVVLLLLETIETRGNQEDALSRRDIFQRIRRNLQRMNHLIVDLLDLTKLGSERGIQLCNTDLAHLLRQVEENWSNSAQQKQISLHFTTQLLHEMVYIDPNLIHRVLDNLLSNAIKYTPAGGAVTVKTEQLAEQLMVEVRDTGIGVAATDLPNLFIPFYRVPQKGHDAPEGTGLGLAIVESIIKNHRGTISVESEVNQGSAFRFAIPWQPRYMNGIE